jgi:hypothetical protein
VMVFPETTKAIATFINVEAPGLNDESKRKLFAERAVQRVDALFKADGSFKIYKDCNTIVLGSLDVPEKMVTKDFLKNFSSVGGRPFICLVDTVIRLYALVVSEDEAHITLDISVETVSHGSNIQAPHFSCT